MQKIEQTINSREIAEMVGKDHNKLLRDIHRYVKQLGEAKIGHSDFFRESTYHSEQNKELPCYRITKKGCEFIAHKLTGTKGTEFTAKYINRFHQMEHFLIEQKQEERIELEELKTAIIEQGKMLSSISRKLSHYRMIGTGIKNEQEMYKREILNMIESLNDREVLCKIYTYTKYVPRTSKAAEMSQD